MDPKDQVGGENAEEGKQEKPVEILTDAVIEALHKADELHWEAVGNIAFGD